MDDVRTHAAIYAGNLQNGKELPERISAPSHQSKGKKLESLVLDSLAVIVHARGDGNLPAC
jgi:hypothetical protein